MEPPVVLSCHECGVPFSRAAREVRRWRNKGREHFYCSRQCMGHGIGFSNWGDCRNRSAAHLNPGNRRDRFSPFRYFMAKARNRKHETDLDLVYLADLWEGQEGRCALSGRPLSLPPTTRAWDSRKGDPWKPSLDRIDSSRGYVRGNVRFVSVIANFAKQAWSDEVLIEFCREVAAHHDEKQKSPEG